MNIWGSKTVFKDVNIPFSAMEIGSGAIPGLAQFKNNGAGSTGSFLRWFDPTTEEELHFTISLPPDHKLGTDIRVNVYWTPKINGGMGNTVSWGFEYTWADIGTTFSNTTIISSILYAPSDMTFVAGRYYLTKLPLITPPSGAGVIMSSNISCRIFRDASGALGVDSFAGDSGLLLVNFRYQADSIGAREEYVK